MASIIFLSSNKKQKGDKGIKFSSEILNFFFSLYSLRFGYGLLVLLYVFLLVFV